MPISFNITYERGANILKMNGVADRYWSHLQQRARQFEQIYNAAIRQIESFGGNGSKGFTVAQKKEHKKKCIEEAVRKVDDLARLPRNLSPANTREAEIYEAAFGRVIETAREFLTKL